MSNYIPLIRYALESLHTRAPVVLEDPVKRRFRLVEDFYVTILDTRVRIPKGETVDLASVPRPFWWLIAPHELTVEATLVHDLIWKYKGVLPAEWFITGARTFTRRESDQALREIALLYGAKPRKVGMAYRTLRATWSVPDALGITKWEHE